MTSKENNNSPGDNGKVFKELQRIANKMKPIDRYCILLFLEFGLKVVKCHEDEPERPNPPTHTYSFTLRGINIPWKQPITNCLVRQHQRKPNYLAAVIKDTIQNVLKSGLFVVATVSAHDRISIEAIEILCRESQEHLKCRGKYLGDFEETFVIDYNIIHHIYDPCRLLKSLRNHLKEKNLIYEMDNKKSTVTWHNIVRMFSIDKARNQRQKLKLLTVKHIYCRRSEEAMSTELAAQLLSESVGNEIMLSIQTGDCPSEMEDTGKFILFMDKLFDSCNGAAPTDQKGKSYREPIKSGSIHFQFWTEAMKIIDSMRFINTTGLVYRPACIDKWSSTVQGLKNVWHTLHKAKFKTLDARRFNLDALIYMMEIVRIIQDTKTKLYCPISDGPVLDSKILKMVLITSYGYFELADME